MPRHTKSRCRVVTSETLLKLYTEVELQEAIESAQVPLIETIDRLLSDIERLNELAVSLGASL